MPNLTIKQYSGLSCGAACLLVAAKELGVTQVPPAFALPPSPQLELTTAWERVIYEITAEGKQDYSMPDGIARAAKLLGLDVSVHMSGCLVPKLLEWRYPNVRKQLDNQDVKLLSGTPKLEENQRMLVAVGIGLGLVGLHWVLYRPDTSYMDPAYGLNYTSLLHMGQCYVLKYADTGVYVVVSRGETV